MRAGILGAVVVLTLLVLAGSALAGECIEINTSEYTITQPGCYYLTTDVQSITIDNSVEYAGPIDLNLNGYSATNITLENVPSGQPANITIEGGHIDLIIASLNNNIVEIRDVTIAAGAHFYGSGHVVIDGVSVFKHAFRLYNLDVIGARVEVKNSVVGALSIGETNEPLYMQDVNVLGCACINVGGNADINMVNVRLPGRTAISIGSGEIYIDNVYIDGVLLELNPESVSPGGAYLVYEPQDWETNTEVYYLGFLRIGNGIVSGVNADFLGIPAGISEIRDSTVGHLVFAASFPTFPDPPDFYNTTVGEIWQRLDVETPWNVIDSNIEIGFLYMYSETHSVLELNFSGSRIGKQDGGFYWLIFNEVNVYGGNIVSAGFLSRYWRFEPVSTESTAQFIGTTFSGYGGIGIYIGENWKTLVFDSVYFDGKDKILFENDSEGAEVILNSVDASNNVSISCTGNYPLDIIIAGNTDTSKFSFSGSCNVTAAQKPNLHITTDQTYDEVEEGTPVEFNVTITAFDVPVDNVVVRTNVWNELPQFRQSIDKVIPHIDANQSITLTFELNLPSSPYTYAIHAVVDPDNNIPESDETDNDTANTAADPEWRYYHVNVYRYITSCGTELLTGQYYI
ncbi:TPA: hypothetical protein EYP13_02800, partial [Candidatus Micrarchaeota archaeon]|nr:hypothetical protein [Candidatus Micrarchaeota archaeon]